MGGEDTAWATERIAEGYGIGFCPSLAVYHSHNLGLVGLCDNGDIGRKFCADREVSMKAS